MAFSQKHFEPDSEHFTRITIGLSSPELILERSHGEVTKPETINYRSYKPEKDGLFSERIFGPTKDWECFCGKYRGIRYKGIICDRCGVEITRKDVRRKRMGHIELAVPVVHIWFFKSLPSKIGNLLGINGRDLERIIYYEAYAVIQPGTSGREQAERITEAEYNDLIDTLGPENHALPDSDPRKFIAMMGGQAILELLKRTDVARLSREFRLQIAIETSVQRKQDLIKRLRVIESFLQNQTNDENRPEWMVLKVVPIVPPDLRPLVPLDGGRFATSDLNDLYRRVIIRNNRLRKMIEIKAPDVILRNEKRMLQEAVDSLFDNGRKSVAMRSDGNRPLKSLSDNLRGKQGRFRQNLLGKRVDYSGRSVIVVGPELHLHECGLPKDMAVELFKPFIIRKLIERDYTKTVKSAKRMVERKQDVVWELLEEIIQDHPVLLNRAPTLHRLGIQAFQPILIEGKAIRLHPLVCAAFNADFDGDQMAVHIPLSYEAQIEARLLMLSPRNILHPANGRPIAIPSQDIVLGCYYITKLMPGAKGDGKVLASVREAMIAYQSGAISIHAPIKLRMNGEMIVTNVGRLMFNELIPAEANLGRYFNELITKKRLEEIVSLVFGAISFDGTATYLDNLKSLGFKMATRGGLSISLSDVEVPPQKERLITAAVLKVEEIQSQYEMGLITDGERYNMIIDQWTHTNNDVAEAMFQHMRVSQTGFNPLFMMADSGARGSKEQIRQLAGMRGLMSKPQKTMTGQKGEIIESPITANFKEGLSVLEYFISTHGARKGLADTALKTADAGYLTRRLVDVAQDVIISEVDCGTAGGIVVEATKEGEEISEQLFARIIGRVTAESIYSPETGELLLEENTLIRENEAKIIAGSGAAKVKIRSVLTCETLVGVCAYCYGINMTNGRLVDAGEAVGVIAAQSIGEPGTQLTLRTFHIGGAASMVMTESQQVAKADGLVSYENIEYIERVGDDPVAPETTYVALRRNGIIKLTDENGRQISSFAVPYGANILVENGTRVKAGATLFTWDPYSAFILASLGGTVQFHDIKNGLTVLESQDEQTGQRMNVIIESKDRRLNPHVHIVDRDGKSSGQYILPIGALLMVTEGQQVKAGDPLVKIPRESSKSKDITGGLPRVAELFEARRPKEPSIVTEIDGQVKFGQLRRGIREITVTPNEGGEVKRYQIPVGRHLLVHDNEQVKAGERLTEGAVSPQDILQILGHQKVQEYLVNEIQEVYRLQGVRINDKHIEVIVRQMMQKVRIEDPGDTMHLEGDHFDLATLKRENKLLAGKVVILNSGDSKFEPGQSVDRSNFSREIRRIKKIEGVEPEVRPAKPAVYQQILLGITQASLATESFISAASFQETTRVLTDAAVERKTDALRGLKENVIMGHLIPAGTGLMRYKNLVVVPPEGEDGDPRTETGEDDGLEATVISQTFNEESQRGDIDGEIRRKELAAEYAGDTEAAPGVAEGAVPESTVESEIDS